MNEFDDLFDKKKPEEPEKPKQDGVEDFYFQANLQRRNGFLLLIYIGVLLVFSIITQIYYSYKYSDTDQIVANIVVINNLQVDVTPNEDTDYPFRISMTGALLNNSGIDLPQMWIEVEFYDADENSLGVYNYSDTDIADGEVMSFDESVLADFNPDSYAFRYGFDESSMFYTLIGFLPVFISGLLFLIVDWRAFSYDWQRFRKRLGPMIGQVILGFVMVYAALILAQIILNELNVSGTSQNEMTIQGLFDANPLQIVMLFLLLCVFTPITEEIIFRKVLYNFVQPRTGHAVAIIISGAVFGLMHVITYRDFIQSIPYIFMGMTFGYIYYRSQKNIFVVMGVHFLNNLLSFVIYALMAYGVSIL